MDADRKDGHTSSILETDPSAATVLAELRPTGHLSVHGRRGSGMTTAAEQFLFAAPFAHRYLLHLDEATTEGDAPVLLALALGLDRFDERSVLRAASALNDTVFLLDDVDLAPDAFRWLKAAAPGATWITTSRSAISELAIEIFPTAPGTGIPDLDLLPPGAEILADLPMGIPGSPLDVPTPFRISDTPVRLRRSVRESLGGRASPESVVAALREIPGSAWSAATERPFRDDSARRFFRAAASAATDPALRAFSVAKYGRLCLTFGQASLALEVVREVGRSTLPRREQAALAWIEGDARLQLDDAEALSTHEHAVALADPNDRERIAIACLCAWKPRGHGALWRKFLISDAAKALAEAVLSPSERTWQIAAAAAPGGDADLAQALRLGTAFASRKLGKTTDVSSSRNATEDPGAIDLLRLDALGARDAGRWSAAEALLTRARSLAGQRGNSLAVSQLDLELGDLHLQAGDPTKAVGAWQRALSVAESLRHPALSVRALQRLRIACENTDAIDALIQVFAQRTAAATGL